MSKKIGFAAERQACDYLVANGLKLVANNYYCRWGEIDLIMQDKDCLVFVEVRSRNSKAYGGAAASITFSKQRKLIKTATSYLLTHKLLEKQPTRFDVISIEGTSSDINWIKNAFEGSV